MIEEEKFDILKKQVDSLQIQLSREQKPWYLMTSNIVAISALLFSFGTTGVSFFNGLKEDVRANRRETRALIQRLTKLPIENFELIRRYQGDALGVSLSGAINQENILLATQATELLDRYPDSFSSTEYLAVANALGSSSITHGIPKLLDAAINRAKNANDYTQATRAYAGYHFAQENYSAGRDYFKMALAVWDLFPEKIMYVVNSFDLLTLMYWSQSEAMANEFSDATDLIVRAREKWSALPPGPQTDSYKTQIEFTEEQIKVAQLRSDIELGAGSND